MPTHAQVVGNKRDVSTGTADQEVNFWLNKERALEDVRRIMQSDEVEFTRNVFLYNKRMNVTSIFKEKDESLAADIAEGIGHIVARYGAGFRGVLNFVIAHPGHAQVSASTS